MFFKCSYVDEAKKTKADVPAPNNSKAEVQLQTQRGGALVFLEKEPVCQKELQDIFQEVMLIFEQQKFEAERKEPRQV